MLMNKPTNPSFKCLGNSDCLAELAKDMRTEKVIPNDFYSHPWANGPKSVAVKFIDEQNNLLRFINSVNYATLYNASSPRVSAYFDLGKNPQPNTFTVFYNPNTIVTAPKAKILVMGQSTVGDIDGNGSGIIVYRFDDKEKKLIRIWAPEGPAYHPRITNPDNMWEM
jgi:hypothetical protein